MSDEWVYGDMAEMTIGTGSGRFMMFIRHDHDQFGRWVVIASTWKDTYGPGYIGGWEYPEFSLISRRIEDE